MAVQFDMDVEVSFSFDWKNVLREAVLQAAEYVHCPYEIDVNVLLTDDERIHEMNREFRQIDRATDVLSFPMADYERPGDFSLCEREPEAYFHPESGELLLGDIVLSVEKVYAQAQEYGHTPKRELAFLTVHSMLHLFGYDHMEEGERQEMEKAQEEIMQILQISRECLTGDETEVKGQMQNGGNE